MERNSRSTRGVFDLSKYEDSVGGAQCMLILGGCFGCFVLAFAIMTVIVTGVYGLNNPDPSACYVAQGVLRTAMTEEEIIQIAKEAGIADPVVTEYHEKFVSWFAFGFWIIISSIAIQIIVSILGCVNVVSKNT